VTSLIMTGALNPRSQESRTPCFSAPCNPYEDHLNMEIWRKQ